MEYKPTEEDHKFASDIWRWMKFGTMSHNELAQKLCDARIEAFQKGIKTR